LIPTWKIGLSLWPQATVILLQCYLDVSQRFQISVNIMKCFSTCHSDPSCIVLSNFSISRPIPLVFSRLPAKARIKDKYMIQLKFKHHIMPKPVSNRRSLPAFFLQVQTGLGCLILAEHRPPYSAVNLPHTFE
jgi:hypothetical protein